MGFVCFDFFLNTEKEVGMCTKEESGGNEVARSHWLPDKYHNTQKPTLQRISSEGIFRN